MPLPTPAQLGTVIRRTREGKELSIEALAAKAGVSWRYLSQIERGKANPTWIVLSGIARGLGIEISDLVQQAEHLAGNGSP